MDFWTFVKFYIGSNLVIVIAIIALLVALLVWAFLSYTFKERKLLKKYDAKKLRDSRYCSNAVYTLSLAKAVEINHNIQYRSDLAIDGVFYFRMFGSTVEAVGNTNTEGLVRFTMDQWCNEQDSFNASSIWLDPTILVKS